MSKVLGIIKADINPKRCFYTKAVGTLHYKPFTQEFLYIYISLIIVADYVFSCSCPWNQKENKLEYILLISQSMVSAKKKVYYYERFNFIMTYFYLETCHCNISTNFGVVDTTECKRIIETLVLSNRSKYTTGKGFKILPSKEEVLRCKLLLPVL